MANKNVIPRFKKGVCPNPKGRPKGATTKAELKQYTAQLIADTINKLMGLAVPELQKIAANPITPSIEAIIARGLVKDKLQGTMNNFDRILDRAIGKVPIKQQITGADGKDLIPPTFNITPVAPPTPPG